MKALILVDVILFVIAGYLLYRVIYHKVKKTENYSTPSIVAAFWIGGVGVILASAIHSRYQNQAIYEQAQLLVEQQDYIAAMELYTNDISGYKDVDTCIHNIWVPYRYQLGLMYEKEGGLGKSSFMSY